MKLSIPSIPLVSLFLSVFLAGTMQGKQQVDHSETLKDLPVYITALLETDVPDHYLIVAVGETDDFLQFTASEDGVLMDQPLFTNRQKSIAPTIAKVCQEQGLVLEDNAAGQSGGSYNWILSGSSDQISKTIATVFTEAFGLEPNAKVSYEHHGLLL